MEASLTVLEALRNICPCTLLACAVWRRLDVAHVVAGAVPVSGIEEDRKAWQASNVATHGLAYDNNQC